MFFQVVLHSLYLHQVVFYSRYTVVKIYNCSSYSCEHP